MSRGERTGFRTEGLATNAIINIYKVTRQKNKQMSTGVS